MYKLYSYLQLIIQISRNRGTVIRLVASSNFMATLVKHSYSKSINCRDQTIVLPLTGRSNFRVVGKGNMYAHMAAAHQYVAETNGDLTCNNVWPDLTIKCLKLSYLVT